MAGFLFIDWLIFVWIQEIDLGHIFGGPLAISLLRFRFFLCFIRVSGFIYCGSFYVLMWNIIVLIIYMCNFSSCIATSFSLFDSYFLMLFLDSISTDQMSTQSDEELPLHPQAQYLWGGKRSLPIQSIGDNWAREPRQGPPLAHRHPGGCQSSPKVQAVVPASYDGSKHIKTNHPNIISLLQIIESKPRIYLIMELVEGQQRVRAHRAGRGPGNIWTDIISSELLPWAWYSSLGPQTRWYYDR